MGCEPAEALVAPEVLQAAVGQLLVVDEGVDRQQLHRGDTESEQVLHQGKVGFDAGDRDPVEARHVVNSVYVDDKIRDYIVDLVLATRPPIAASFNLNGYIQTGASPRATIALTLGARAMAFLNGRHFVTPQDVKSIALDVLRHRVSVTYEAEAENVTSENVIEKILNTLPVP